MAMDAAVRQLIRQQAGARDIQHAAQKNGMRTLRTNSIQKVLAGITTVEEVLRITNSI
jgi:type II secretory ATPase GspE/PulE/Tfp pilus assembly ATPase PilB-like protein